MMESYNRTPNVQCKICETKVYRRPFQLKKSSTVYCSHACYGKATEKLHKCAVCENMIQASKHKKTCSRACANKQKIGLKYGSGLGRAPKNDITDYFNRKNYLIKLQNGHCINCDYSKIEILHIHHKIERCNGGSNDLNNLELICPNCHAEEHYRRRLESKT